MAVTMEEYLKALKDINFALTGGLETAIAVLENFEKLTQKQRQSMIGQLKELVEASHNVYRSEPTKH